MKDLMFFNSSITSGKVEFITPLFPIQEKFIRFTDIQQNIVPSIVKLKKNSLKELNLAMKTIIQEHELFRSVIIHEENGGYFFKIFKYTDNITVPVYECNTQQSFNLLISKIAKNLIERPVFNHILFNLCFIKFNGEIYFCGIFNHMVFDGGFEFQSYLENPCNLPRSTFSKFETHIKNCEEQEKEDFDNYFKIKKELLREYKSYDLVDDYIDIQTDLLFSGLKISVEEFWVVIIYNALFQAFNEYEALPMNILTNGRKFGDILFSKDFGDFHDEITLFEKKISNKRELVDRYRNYRKNPFTNAKSYIKNLHNIDDEFCSDIDPIILLIAGDGPIVEKHIQTKEMLPKRQKSYVLSIKVLVKPNLKNFRIYFRYSNKIANQIETLKDQVIKTIQKKKVDLGEYHETFIDK